MKLFSFIISFIILISFKTFAKETWILDKNLSTINFELPVFLANNVQGEFKDFEGLVEIDLDTKKNNKAIFSVEINSIEMNYKKYKNLLLSNVFFHANIFPKALIDTKKFSYNKENILELKVELIIKGTTSTVPLNLEIITLTEELVQIKGKLEFSRTNFEIGLGKWKNTTILRDKAIINVNLFLFKQ